MYNGYIMEMDESPKSYRIEKLKSILNTMQIFMESYHFNDYLRKTRINPQTEKEDEKNGYTFYYVQGIVDATQGDLDFLRESCHVAFTVWNNVLRQLGVGLPTYRSSVKKKVIDSLFSLVSNEIDEDKLIKDFEKWDHSHTKFDFVCYCIAHMKDYDLDFNMSWVGKARSSKTSGMATLFENVYSARGIDLYSQVDGRPYYETLLDQRYILSQRNASAALRTGDGDINWFDESYRTHDRRKSMSRAQVEMTGDANFYASKKPINVKLIQNFSDMDLRSTTKDNAVIVNTGRGEGLLFADQRFIALAKDQFGFEDLISNPNILKYPPMAIHLLKRQGSYVCEISWPKRKAWEDNGVIHGADKDPLYAYCLKLKIAGQAVIEAEKAKGRQPASMDETSVKYRVMQALYKAKGKLTQSQIAEQVGCTKQYVGDIVKAMA